MNKYLRWGAFVILPVVLMLSWAGAASAQQGSDPYVGPSPTVESEVVDRGVPSAASATATSSPAPEVEATGLAFTGGDVGVLLGVGAAAVVAGALLLLSRRRTLA